MAATVRSAATYASTATEATSTVALPAGWRPNDVVYIGCQLTAATGTITTPAGWTAAVAGFRSAASTSATMAVLRRVMQPGDTDPAIGHTSGRFAAVTVAIQGVDPAVPEDVTPTADTNTAVVYPDVRAPSISPVTPGLLLTLHGVRNVTNSATTTFTPPTGMTEVAEVSTAVAATSNAAIAVASLALTDPSATGAKTATATSSSGTSINGCGVTIVVRPAPQRASSSPTVTAARTSSPTASAARTSTPAVTAGRTSAPTVSGG